MRKILISLLTILLLGFSIYIAVYGLSLGNLEIKSIPAIQAENLKLETKIETASKLRNTDYPQSIASLENSYKKLTEEKDNYEQMLALGVDENGETLNKIAEYEMEKIWITLGNYAKKQGVDLKIAVTSNNTISNTYDLNFTLTGGYIQIIDFLYDMERDTTLIFKIENFKMVPGESTESLVATFTCKDIKLNITENENNTQTSINENSNTNNNTNTNSTSNTNSTNTTNATN